VIASACDANARVAAGGTKLSKDAPVLGLLFGTKRDNIISVCETTDVLLEKDENNYHIVESEIQKKTQLWTAVYTSYELLGWYTFSESISSRHFEFHNSLAKYCQDPMLILFNQQLNDQQLDNVPMKVYKLENVESKKSFVEVSYHVESSDIENFALDEIMKSLPTNGLSTFEQQNQTIKTSLSILENRTSTIIEALELMNKGEMPIDHSLLRSAANICQTLQASKSMEITSSAFCENRHNSLLNSYIGISMKNFHMIQEVSELCAMLNDQRGGSM